MPYPSDATVPATPTAVSDHRNGVQQPTPVAIVPMLSPTLYASPCQAAHDGDTTGDDNGTNIVPHTPQLAAQLVTFTTSSNGDYTTRETRSPGNTGSSKSIKESAKCCRNQPRYTRI